MFPILISLQMVHMFTFLQVYVWEDIVRIIDINNLIFPITQLKFIEPMKEHLQGVILDRLVTKWDWSKSYLNGGT